MLDLRFTSSTNMGLELLLLVAALVILLAILVSFRGSDPRLPPSPTRPLPLLGHLLTLNRDFRPQFQMWRKQCGDIFSLQMAGTLVVVLNGQQVLKEAFINKAEYFSDRPHLFLDQATGYPRKGVVFTSGEEWREQRAVTMTILRSLGLGQNILAEKIQKEVEIYVDYLSNLKGKPANILHQTTVSVANIICSIMIGQRFSYEDTEFKDLVRKLQFTIADLESGNLLNFIPWLQYLPGDLFHAKKAVSNFEDIMNVLKKFIERKNTTDVSLEEADNFISAYLSEINRKVQANKETYMDEDSLIKILLELFTAGTDTTTFTIYWCILYMLNYPDVQEKVHSEIISVVGKDRTPTLEDKPKLNYLNATILEIQRIISLSPLGLAHVCPKDVTLKGYRLPKGTIILPNLDSVHHDAEVWGADVMTFRPERFLDEEGLIINQDKITPFGLGRRICLGENLAKMELFLFLSSMFQKLKFLPLDPKSPPSTNYVCRIVIAPQQYQVIVIERK